MSKNLQNNFRKASLKRSVSALAIAVATFCASGVFAQSPETFNTSGTWTCPVGTTFVQVECYGAGGAGGGGVTTTPNAGRVGGGGGSGSYVKKTITVVPGLTYNITVGMGGAPSATINNQLGFGGSGGKTEFSGNAITPVTASGGTGGSVANPQNNSTGAGGVLGGVYGITVAGSTVGQTSLDVDNTGTNGSGLVVANGAGNGYVTISNQGSGYTSAPTLTATGATTQPSFTLLFNPNINSTVSFQEDVILAGNNGGVGSGIANASFSADGGNAPGPAGGLGGAGIVNPGTSPYAPPAPNPGVVPGGGGAGSMTGTAGQGSKPGAAGADGLIVLTFPAAAPTVLPVSLISFNASASNNQAKLSWSTASEANNNRFEIQRSSDNKTYVTVATVKGNGTTSQKSTYVAYDENPENGVNYYKLVQIDNDGTTKELAIKSVNFSFAKVFAVSVYPNPASGVLNVSVNSKTVQKATALLIGSNGSVYFSQALQLNAGANTKVINLGGNVAPGQYVLSVAGTDLKESVKVIVK